jgi:hypothetical protein
MQRGVWGFASVYIRLEGLEIVEQKLTALTHEIVKFDWLALQPSVAKTAAITSNGASGEILAQGGFHPHRLPSSTASHLQCPKLRDFAY